MLSIHVLSFLFFCLFVRPSACLAVLCLFFMLLLFQEWYLITKLPSYLRKGDLKLRKTKTVEIPNCDTIVEIVFLVLFAMQVHNEPKIVKLGLGGKKRGRKV